MDTVFTFSQAKERVRKFRDDRDWKQFHTPKDLAEATSIEANELLALFLWKTSEQVAQDIARNPKYLHRIQEEMADVLMCILHMANALDIDLSQALCEKVTRAEEKYPIEKSKGNNKKYTELA